MSINIKNREVEARLDAIEAATGAGTTRIVPEPLRREAGHLRRQRRMTKRRAMIEAISRRYGARLPARPLSPDALVGYDEDGLPT